MLSPTEKIEAIRQVYSILKLLCDTESLAGIILTDETYEQVKQIFGDAKFPYRPAEVDLDPAMEHSFVVNELLILRGTRLAD